MSRWYRLFVALSAAIVHLSPSAAAQPVVVEATADPSREQLPILFHHGFNDDGRLWAIGSDGAGTGSAAAYWDALSVRSADGTVLQNGIPNYVVQYWAQSDAPGFVDGDENATAEEGFAALLSPQQIRTPGENFNSPDPIGYFNANAGALLGVIPECDFSITGVSCTFPATEFLLELRERMVTSNYNRNGLVTHHSQDLADLFGALFSSDARFSGLRQVNMITHSAGGLDTRATLHRLNQSEDPLLRETVANVIYTAPPFGGSTAAIFAGRLYAEDLDASVFQDPWLLNGAGSLTLRELLIAVARSFVSPQAEGIVATLIDFVPKPLGLDPTSVTVEQLATTPPLAIAAVEFIEALRGLVTGVIGFPGEPKVTQDLTPWSAVDNLNRWQPNFETKQFVTWGEGGGRINLAPSLAVARAAYDAGGNCCDEFLDPETLDRPADDWALADVSARMLATPQGGMEELRGYPTLWHGNINTDMQIVGMDWVETLITPVTALELTGPVPTIDASRRFYRVGPATTVRFVPEAREVSDQFRDEATVVAQAVEYRLVTFPIGQPREHHPWVQTTPNASVSFADLASSGADLSGEREFALEWRSLNQAGAREAVRSARFSIDDTPPSITLIEVFTPGIADSPEIKERGLAGIGGMFRRSELITRQTGLPNLDRLLDAPETDWIISNPANKILRIDFDEPGAQVRYQWDDFFTNPTNETLLNVSLAFPLAELEPGPHTLYFEVSDAAGNTTNAVQAVSVLVDDQAPIVGLNYEPTGGLGFVVGRETPLSFTSEDVETGVVSGGLTVPGLGTIAPNETFRMGQTAIADAAEGTDVLGLIVNLQANVTDGVGNTAQKGFDVYYDFSPPRIELQHVGNSVLTTDGTYRTTDAVVRLEVRVTDNAGYQLPTWTGSQPGTTVLRSGAPLVIESRDGRPLANGTNVVVGDGMNVLVVSVTDLVGNTASMQVLIEKVQTLIEDDANRPIELLSLHVEGAPTGRTGPLNASASDDGSVFIFDSSRRDHVAADTNDERDIFVWRSSALTRANTSATGEEATGGESRNPALSGDGRYAYFASQATNLVSESVSGVNLYVKDLETGRIALISRNESGQPANMGAAFARLSFLRVSPTYSGRYVFFDDRYNGYVADDQNGNTDIFVADLDPDVDGDFFDAAPVIRRVSVAADGSEGTGGLATGGSRYPSVSRDGLFLAFQTDHTNLFPGDDNGVQDAVLTRFAGVDAQGTIDFSSSETIPLAVDAQGAVATLGSQHPTVDRTGRTVVFTTSSNLSSVDDNSEGADNDVYRSTGFLENWTNRVVTFESADAGGGSSAGRIAPNHAPSVADYTAEDDPRVAYLADKSAVVEGDLNGAVDLFVNADAPEAINWLGATVPSTLSVAEGGITSDGTYAWWITSEEYSTVVGVGTGLDLYRRRIDPEAETEAPRIITAPTDATALIGENVAFSVAATGRPLPAYQWHREGVPIVGATNPTLFLSSVTFDDEGTYAVTIENEAGVSTTPGARLTVTSLVPAFVSQPAAVDVQEGEPVTFGASVRGLAPLEFQWRRNGIALENGGGLTGAQSDTLRIASAAPTDAGTYTLSVANPGGIVQSVPVDLAVRTATSADLYRDVPAEFALSQNYPNPFNPTTTIRYALPQQERVRLEVFNLLGQRVALLVDAALPAGWHEVTLDGRNLASGTYFYVITAGSYRQARSLLLMK